MLIPHDRFERLYSVLPKLSALLVDLPGLPLHFVQLRDDICQQGRKVSINLLQWLQAADLQEEIEVALGDLVVHRDFAVQRFTGAVPTRR